MRSSFFCLYDLLFLSVLSESAIANDFSSGNCSCRIKRNHYSKLIFHSIKSMSYLA
jgi:hypothetical protein